MAKVRYKHGPTDPDALIAYFTENNACFGARFNFLTPKHVRAPFEYFG